MSEAAKFTTPPLTLSLSKGLPSLLITFPSE